MTWIPVTSYLLLHNHYIQLGIPISSVLWGISFRFCGFQDLLFPVLLARKLGCSWSFLRFLSVVPICLWGYCKGGVEGKETKITGIRFSPCSLHNKGPFSHFLCPEAQVFSQCLSYPCHGTTAAQHWDWD